MKLSESEDDEQTLLAALTLEDFRCGRQFTRDHRRWKTGEFWVYKLWRAFLLPSFDPHISLMCASAKHVQHEREMQPDWHRAALIIRPGGFTKTTVTCDLESDPVESSLDCISLVPKDGGLSLDGIGYNLSVDTSDLRANLTFSNPQNEQWRKVEKALFEVVSMILGSEPVSGGDEILQILERYQTRSG